MTNAQMTKSGIEPLPILTYKIGTGDITTYLRNQLGFDVAVDYRRWTGITANHSYVRMRVVILPKDICVTSKSKDFVDRTLSEYSAGMTFKDDVIDTLKPFMYPKNINDLRNYPEVMQHLYEYGVYGDRLNEIIEFSKLNYSKDANLFRVYLRPERIIAQMLEDPSTNEISGNMVITRVLGDTPETFQWEVQVTEDRGISTTGISIDKIFSMN
jgi:hypothetical protein